ncbi:MAG TPA: hypothetical protein IAB59_00230 [Candidatus Onthousia faecipullorum]|uniref:Uncharacterized protein n=1 Tax=Candidatus Onthousia faecipullorum TaxID=2840887 RepID=A0A9D1KC40_9FIRM|nr:hypothetical protein [Candidatus Onthousia faecipullorum]
MELKEGMYVRFNYHRVTVPIQIAKIKEKYYDEMEKYYYYLTDNGLIISEENIIKPSENILDLIEVGDYVNGKRVYNISIVDGLKYLDVEVEDYLSDMPFINADQITSIVTKEQFSSMKYEVK